MLKVINISSNNTVIYFTADTTLISADTILYTADQTILTHGSVYEFVVPYRFFEEDVKFYMINDLTNKDYLIELTATDYNNGTLMILIDHEFKVGDNFNATIRNMNDDLIWRGRIFATDQTDLQNFKVNVPNENGIIKI